jgi:hypothetical protein
LAWITIVCCALAERLPEAPETIVIDPEGAALEPALKLLVGTAVILAVYVADAPFAVTVAGSCEVKLDPAANGKLNEVGLTVAVPGAAAAEFTVNVNGTFTVDAPGALNEILAV